MNQRQQKKKDDLELTIISILLRNPEKLLSTQIQTKWFGKHQCVISEIFKMSGEGIEIDAVSLAERLIGKFELAEIVHWQRDIFGAQANYEHYLKLLEDIYLDLGIEREFEQAISHISNGDTPKDTLAAFLSNINTISNEKGKNFTYDMKEALRVFVEDLEVAYDKNGGYGLKLGFEKIDESLGGLQETDLIVIGARPSVGKTSFALSVIRNLGRQGKSIGFFSTEMGVSQITGRLVSMDTKINGLRIREAKLEESEFTRITASSSKMMDYKIRICDKPSITANEIMMQAKAWNFSEKMDLIIVDYLTRIKLEKKNNNQNLDVGEIITTMKNIARTLKVPVMVLAQLNREVTKRSNKRPAMSDLRDSGIIEQEADQILLLNRPSEEPEEEQEAPRFSDKYKPKEQRTQTVKKNQFDEIIIDKNRHGETGVFIVKFDKEFAMWHDCKVAEF